MATQLTAPSTFSAGQTAGVSANLNVMANDLIYLSGAALGRKNVLINSVGFPVNQRAAANVSTTGYGVDRWLFTLGSGATSSITPTNSPPALVSGFTKQYLAWTRTVTGSTATTNEQRIESVTTFAGQTATVSILMSSASGTVDLVPAVVQNFGSGGSPSGAVTTTGATLTATTTPTIYTYTFAVPSISGKTIGTTSGTDYLSLVLSRPTSGNGPTVALNIIAVQFELGSAFTGWEVPSQQETLAQCQRYFWRPTSDSTATQVVFGTGSAASTTSGRQSCRLPTTMRATPTIDTTSAAATFMLTSNAANVACSATPALNGAQSTRDVAAYVTTVAAGLTGGAYYDLVANSSSAAYIALTAEL